MVPPIDRDIRNLQREDLLDDYWEIAKSRGDALVSTALRTQSISMRDILSHAALHSSMTSDELKHSVIERGVDVSEVRNVHALADLGRLVLLQNLLPGDLDFGEQILFLAHELSGEEKLSERSRRVLIEYEVERGDRQKATKLLEDSPDIDQADYGYLRSELSNPFLTEDDRTEEWHLAFNRPFTENGLAPVSFTIDGKHPFDRLTTAVSPSTTGKGENDPLVTVVLTTYRPEINELMTSVRSVLEQTWENLELILVDDCSGQEYSSILEEVQKSDRRVKVIRNPEPLGTYKARNLGYALSRGDFITGQDDDDWSHPERLHKQVQFMLQNPDRRACRATAIRTDVNMSRCRLGIRPIAFNPSSFMLTREAYESVGDYLDSGKGADSEYYSRVETVSGVEVGDINVPLSIIRIRPNSESRGDCTVGRHPARLSFQSAYSFWHHQSRANDLRVTAESEPAVAVPSRYQIRRNRQEPQEFDVVFAGDWQRYGGPQKSMLEEIYALMESGYRIAILNLDAARFMSEDASEPLNDPIQSLINEGSIGEVFFDDNAHVRLLILRYPPILQFFADGKSRLKVDSMIIVANQAPSELDGSDIRYLVGDCHRNAERAFGITPRWVPQGPQVREFLDNYMSAPTLTDFDMPGILDVEAWWHERLWFRSTIPVVGRHSRDNPMKWPSDKAVLQELYRVDGEYDVRFMGGHRTPMAVLETSKLPAAWTVYQKDALPVPYFLYSLDYFVFFQHPYAVEAFGRAILEALASGTVVILPRHFESVFGDAALYADAFEVREMIGRLHSDFSLYQEQLAKSKATLQEEFSYKSYRRLVENLLSPSQTQRS